MPTYVALLRAVNVGGTGKLPMADLRALCEVAGFTNVRTYIASGNVVFTSLATAADVKAALQTELATYAGKHVGVVVFTPAEMAEVLASNPYSDRAPNRSVAIFLDDAPPPDALEKMSGRRSEDVALGDRVIYVHYGEGMAESKLKLPAAATGTARNMNTVAAILKLAESTGGAEARDSRRSTRPTALMPGVVNLGRVSALSTPPTAPRHPHTWDRITGPSEDPWAWLRDREHPDTVPYLVAENEYADAWFGERAELVETLFTELKSRILETDLGVPSRRGDWWYVSRTEEGKSYSIMCRGATSETAADHVILDENAEAGDHEFFELGALDVSPSHRLLAWSLDTDGGEEFELRIRRLADDPAGAHHDLPDRIERTYYGTAWSSDDEWLFYVRPDEQMRPFQVWRHRLGMPASDDFLVFEEPDERFYIALDQSRSSDWIIIDVQSKQTSEVLLIPAGAPELTPAVVRHRIEGVEYGVDHWGDRFVVLTNLDAVDFRVMTAPTTSPDTWTELIAHQPGVRITAAEPFEHHLVLHEWSDAQPRLRVVQRDGSSTAIHLADEPHDVELAANPEYNTATLRYTYQSLTAPASVWDVDLLSGERTLLKQTPVLGVDLAGYVAQRLWATSPDGTRVPVDIVYHRDTPLDGTAPSCLYGYGSYEASMPPWFSAARLSLLDRGWVWALAHPRGGGEMGRAWYLKGRLEHKRNTFLDFIACAKELGSVADSSRIAIRGGSAGGLLVGASVTMAPSDFAAVVAEVPFVDVVSTMLDASLPLTITEWEEWGNPATEPLASYMLGYSPYDNIAAVEYPPMLVTAGLNDPRVSFHEPAKWVAKLRAVATPRPPLLLKTEMGAGHGGPSGRYDSWREEARTLAFLLEVV